MSASMNQQQQQHQEAASPVANMQTNPPTETASSSTSVVPGSSNSARTANNTSRTSQSETSAAAAATPLQATLPSPETQRHIAEARAAVVASIGNLVDSELQTRASLLHDNATALNKQEKDVVRATDGLRREREKLAKEADAAARKLKEVGNVQNWAEVLERGFLILEETVRLANGGREQGGDGDSWSGSESGSGSGSVCSCSDCGRQPRQGWGDGMTDGERGDNMDVDVDVNGGVDGEAQNSLKDQDPANVDVDVDVAMEGDTLRETLSDASCSILEEAESSAGTLMAKGSETASASTST